ncbi:MAG: ribonuclease D [Polyangiaceae bacterium]
MAAEQSDELAPAERPPPADLSPRPAQELVRVDNPSELSALAERAGRAEALAVDVEADGLFAYRAKLCTLQLAFREGARGTPEERMVVAIVDALAVPVSGLTSLFAAGPVQVLHDLTFDARLLGEAGAPLGQVRDTSVAARLLGRTSTGLAALLAEELGVHVEKRFQQHDWARRPLGEEHLRYLAGDVAHLLELDARLAAALVDKDLVDEADAECRYKLQTATLPPRDARPAYVRIKGASALDAVGRAVLRRLVEARETAAARADVPPFKVVGNDVLLELARRRPGDAAGVSAVRGAASGRAASRVRAWVEAIVAGMRDGEVPAADRVHFEPQRVDRAQLARRRARESQISAWRRREAKARGVDEQAVLPATVRRRCSRCSSTRPRSPAEPRPGRRGRRGRRGR